MQAISPRVIRLRDAPSYLGMDKNRFNAEVRPYITEIAMGSKSTCFNKLEALKLIAVLRKKGAKPIITILNSNN